MVQRQRGRAKGARSQSIRYKLTTIILSVSLVSLLALGTATISNVVVMRNSVYDANQQLGTIAEENSAEALEKATTEKLSSVAQYVAQVTDEKLNRSRFFAEMLAGSATTIFSDPDEYPDRKINPPSVGDAGKLALYYIHPSDVTDAEVLPEAMLAANCAEIMLQLRNIDSTVQSNYISFLDTGLHVVCDESADKRLAADYAGYDPRTRGWFKNAVEGGVTVFSDLTDDALGRGYGIVCSAPFFNAKGETIGAVGVGSLIVDINELILTLNLGRSSEAFVLNKDGQMIIGRDIQKDDSGKSVRPDLNEAEDEALKALLRSMNEEESGIGRVRYKDREVYMAFAHIDNGDWTLVTTIDVDEALELSAKTAAEIGAAADESTKKVNDTIRLMILTIALVTLVTVGGVLLVGIRQSKRLTDPLLKLTEGVKEISTGNLDEKISVLTGDELESLADAFNVMTTRLKEYIANLTAVTAEKERIGAELGVATSIQHSMLPSIFPPFPERTEFDLYATMQPAKEVGGDFYDFFLVDDDHLALVIADVSGKGVPAALFMVIAKTLIKNSTQTGLPPAEVFEKVNKQLCEGNDAQMFVTAWLGILTISTGKMVCVSAGHEYPTVRRAGGRFELIKDRHGFVLAGMETARYREYEMDLGHGDVLFVYTDGVAEATDAGNELYGTERMLNALNKSAEAGPEELLPIVKADIDAFVKEAPQFDDITMLSLRLR